MDRNQKILTIPELTPEERQVLAQTRREALFYRVVPLAALTNGALFLRFRQTNTQPAVKIFSYGSMSVFAFIIGVASYGREFRRRIDALEDSPLKDAFRRRESGQPWQSPQGRSPQGFPQPPGASQWQNPPAFNQTPTTGPFVGSNDPYSPFPSNGRRRGQFDDGQRFPPQTGTDPYNNRSDDRYEFSQPHSDGYLNQESAVSPYNFPHDQPQPPTTPQSSSATEPQKYMSYKDRRLFYRNNPDAKGVIDPFGYSKSRPNGRAQETPPPYQNDNFSDQPQASSTAERPFIPFFDEGTAGQSGGRGSDQGSF